MDLSGPELGSQKKKVKKGIFIFLSGSQIISVSATSSGCCCCGVFVLFFLKKTTTNAIKILVTPALTVTRPCPDGIRSNTSLMPQTLYATAAGGGGVYLRICASACANEPNCECTPPLQISAGHPAVGEVAQSSGGIRAKTAGVEFVKLLRTTLPIRDTFAGCDRWQERRRPLCQYIILCTIFTEAC